MRGPFAWMNLIRLRLWWNLDGLSVPVVMIALAVLLGGLAWLQWPMGATRQLEGRIVGIGFIDTDEGSRQVASVRADGRDFRVRLPQRHGCKAGDRIALSDMPTRFGRRTGVAPRPRPCAED